MSTISAPSDAGIWYDVADYGAVGDGTNDDAAAIQAAIDAAIAAGGGVVWMGPGTYRITSTLDLSGLKGLNHGIELRGAGNGTLNVGAGAATTIANESGGIAIKAYGDKLTGFTAHPITSPILRSFRIQNTADLASDEYTIDFDYVTDKLWLADLEIQANGHGGNGIRLLNHGLGQGGLDRVRVYGFTTGTGVKLGCFLTANVESASSSGGLTLSACAVINCLVGVDCEGGSGINYDSDVFLGIRIGITIAASATMTDSVGFWFRDYAISHSLISPHVEGTTQGIRFDRYAWYNAVVGGNISTSNTLNATTLSKSAFYANARGCSAVSVNMNNAYDYAVEFDTWARSNDIEIGPSVLSNLFPVYPGVIYTTGAGGDPSLYDNNLRVLGTQSGYTDGAIYGRRTLIGNMNVGTLDLGSTTDTTLVRSSAGNVTIDGNLIYRAGGTDVPVTDGGTGASDASTARFNLGLTIGGTVQEHDVNLDAIAGLTTAPDKGIYWTGLGSAALYDVKSGLRAIGGLVSATDRLPYFDGVGSAALATFTAAGRALVDDADASAQRTTLGLGTVATQAWTTGTWTPAFAWDTEGDASWAYSIQSGWYRRLGDLVFCGFRIATSTSTHTTASGYLTLTGLPVASSGSLILSTGGVIFRGTATTMTSLGAEVQVGTTTALFAYANGTAALAYIIASNHVSGDVIQVRGQFVYLA